MQQQSRPAWLVQRIPAGGNLAEVQQLMGSLGLNTVCLSASCPNLGECYGARTATFLILGGICTRNCKFCAVPKGCPDLPDMTEAERVVWAVEAMGLTHVVITSVTRDDLPDGGASLFVRCLELLRQRCPGASLEVLVPDFAGDRQAVDAVLAAKPDVFNHNLETVPRLYPAVRPGADYRRSLAVLQQAAEQGIRVVKSGLMLGLGEDREEVLRIFNDLLEHGANGLTLGQYLRPSPEHAPVAAYIHPDCFAGYEEQARRMGFRYVSAGPLVRSSYHAANFLHPRD